MKVSVVIVNYKTSRVLKRSLPRIYQDSAVGEVIVIDNSCSLDEVSSLRRLKASYPFRLIFKENIGFGRACNLGIDLARHPWVLIMNGDIIPGKGSISLLLEDAIESKADIAAPSLYMTEWDFFTPPFTSFSLAWEVLLSPLALSTPLRHLSRWLYARFYNGFKKVKKPKRVSFVPGAAFIIKKGIIYFDPHFFLYFEDNDLCLRAREKGLKIVHSPNSKMVHLLSFSTGDRPQKLFFNLSYYLFWKKHRDKSLVWKLVRLIKGIKPGRLSKLEGSLRVEREGVYLISPNPSMVPYFSGSINKPAPGFVNRMAGRLYFKRVS